MFEEEQTLERLPPKIARLGEHLARIARLPHVGDVRQCGLIAGIELVRDKATKEPYPWAEKRGLRVCDHARREGVLAPPAGQRDRHHAAAGDHARADSTGSPAAVERGIAAATE